MVSLVPDLPGNLDVTYALLQTFQQQTVSRSAYDIVDAAYGVSFQRASVGRRRLLADGAPHGSPKAKWASGEYHWDGAGAYSLALGDMRQRARNERPEEHINQLVDDELTVLGILTGLRRLATHARDRAAAGGNALVRVHLLPSTGLRVGVEIGHSRSHGFCETRSQVALTEHIGAAETVASLDELAVPGPALVAVAARLVDELGQVFGIPEMGQLTREGEVRIRYWGRSNKERVLAWADAHGIAVSENTLDE